MPHIGVSVDEGTKRKWADYVENSAHGSMSELVRTAVRKEVRRDGDGSADLPRQAEKRINQIAENQEQITRQMETLSDEFEDVSEAATEQYPEHIVELADDVASELEEVSADNFAELRSEAKDELRSLAVRVCDDPRKADEVGEALEYLADTLSYVKKAPQGPSDYYRVRRR
jgi:archaellum component FlaC